MNKISKQGMFLLIIASLMFVLSLFFPWWGMRLTAPQYKEGLFIYVFPHKIEGQIDIINGLNHYIGMSKFSEESFPELQYLPIIIGTMALITLIIAFIRNWELLLGWLIVIVIGSLIGLYDIYRWLRSFGTELDPKAPIEIEPFIPPVIGTNQLANFETLSFFSYGAALLGLGMVIMVYVIWEGKAK